ncbi:MAG: hypothetical protein HYZ42_10775 [Bacteroidetes bacterium]|nr:hypothetical protein [Bacteroidota bacterium]
MKNISSKELETMHSNATQAGFNLSRLEILCADTMQAKGSRISQLLSVSQKNRPEKELIKTVKIKARENNICLFTLANASIKPQVKKNCKALQKDLNI